MGRIPVRSCFDLLLPRVCLRPQKFWCQSAAVVALLLVPWLFPEQAPGYLQDGDNLRSGLCCCCQFSRETVTKL